MKFCFYDSGINAISHVSLVGLPWGKDLSPGSQGTSPSLLCGSAKHHPYRPSFRWLEIALRRVQKQRQEKLHLAFFQHGPHQRD